MGTAPILTRVSVLMALAAAPAFAGQRGHQPGTPHGTTQAPRQPSTTPTTTSTSTTNPTTSTTTPTTSTTSTTTTNPIATRISRNPQLAGRISHMLPDGMTLAAASDGFRNQGQFIAAVHVSHNLRIPFADLKTAMTGPQAMSLGQAIHTLRPSANATNAVRRANTQTQSDLR